MYIGISDKQIRIQSLEFSAAITSTVILLYVFNNLILKTMCLVTKQRKAKIAKKDIVCYKTLNSDLSSPYQGFAYQVGVLAHTAMEVELDIKDWFPFDAVVTKAYGEPICTRSDRGEIIRDRSANQVTTGFHAALTTERLGVGVDIYEFLIPAGSEYFTDKTGLIVSNQIILVNDVNLYKP